MTFITLLTLTCFFLGLSTATNIVGEADLLGYTDWVDAERRAGLESMLNQTGPFTVFTPSNAAFQALPSSDNTTFEITTLMTYHVVEGLFVTSTLTNDQLLTSILKGQFNQIRVNNYSTISNGAVEGVFVNGQKVFQPNVGASNGIIQGIDGVMMIPTTDVLSLVNTLNTTIFETLLSLSSVTKNVTGSGPFTMFVPTNAAFNKLGQQAVTLLQEPQNLNILNEILQYHIVKGISLFSATFVKGIETSTLLAGENLSFGPGTVNNAQIVTADIVATNGVDHTINTVLIPPTISLTQLNSTTGSATTGTTGTTGTTSTLPSLSTTSSSTTGDSASLMVSTGLVVVCGIWVMLKS